MKLSVRAKVANGLVIFLLMPRAAETAVNLFDTYSNGLKSFAADDEAEPASGKSNIAGVTVNADPAGDPSGGDPTGGDPTGGDPTGGDPSGGDPSGGDPSGGDPSGGDPSGGDPSGCASGTGAPTLMVQSPTELTTAEDGTADAFQVFMVPDPQITRFFQIVSTNPDEARPEPETVTFGEDACRPQSIWVVGQNDGVVDGDINYEIEIRDEQEFVVATIPGLNIDNDSYTGVAVDVIGPNTLPNGGTGTFMIRVTNLSDNPLQGNDLFIEASQGLEIISFAAYLLSGNTFDSKAKLKGSSLSFQKVELGAGDVLLVSASVVFADGGPDPQTLTAHFYAHPQKQISDDDQSIGTSVP